MKLIIEDSNGTKLFECDDVEVKPVTKRVIKHKVTLSDLVWGIIQSMSRRGNCIDNCIMETFFGRMKNEMYYGCEKDYDSFEIFSNAVDEYICYYNNARIQRKTKWMPPVKYRIASMGSA